MSRTNYLNKEYRLRYFNEFLETLPNNAVSTEIKRQLKDLYDNKRAVIADMLRDIDKDTFEDMLLNAPIQLFSKSLSSIVLETVDMEQNDSFYEHIHMFFSLSDIETNVRTIIFYQLWKLKEFLDYKDELLYRPNY